MELNPLKTERKISMENMISQAPLPVPGQQVMVLMRIGNTYHTEIRTIQEPKTGKTAIYCRTASTRPNDFQAIWHQRDKVRAFAFEQGHDIFKIYSDDGFNGNNLDRPAFAEMQVDMAAGKIDTIIVSSVDRIARDYFIIEDWLNQLELMDIRIIAVDGSHEVTPLLRQIHKEIQDVIHGKKRMVAK